jgi:hypothetical protein
MRPRRHVRWCINCLVRRSSERADGVALQSRFGMTAAKISSQPGGLVNGLMNAHFAQIFAVSAVTLVGLLAYVFKKRNQLAYGTFEVVFAGLVAAKVVSGLLPREMPLAQWATLGGLAYVVARGLNNIVARKAQRSSGVQTTARPVYKGHNVLSRHTTPRADHTSRLGRSRRTAPLHAPDGPNAHIERHANGRVGFAAESISEWLLKPGGKTRQKR